MKLAIEIGPVVVIVSTRLFANGVDHVLAIEDEYLAFVQGLPARAQPKLRNSGRSFFVTFATMSISDYYIHKASSYFCSSLILTTAI